MDDIEKDKLRFKLKFGSPKVHDDLSQHPDKFVRVAVAPSEAVSSSAKMNWN